MNFVEIYNFHIIVTNQHCRIKYMCHPCDEFEYPQISFTLDLSYHRSLNRSVNADHIFQIILRFPHTIICCITLIISGSIVKLCRIYALAIFDYFQRKRREFRSICDFTPAKNSIYRQRILCILNL